MVYRTPYIPTIIPNIISPKDMHTLLEDVTSKQESHIPISVITLIDASQNSSSPNTRIPLGRRLQI